MRLFSEEENLLVCPGPFKVHIVPALTRFRSLSLHPFYGPESPRLGAYRVSSDLTGGEDEFAVLSFSCHRSAPRISRFVSVMAGSRVGAA